MIYDVIIVGAGPAGLSAAIYTSRAQLKTLVIEGETQGGLVSTTEIVDNYLGMPGTTGLNMANSFYEHAKMFNAQFLKETVVYFKKENNGPFIVRTKDSGDFHSRTVIFAAGSTPLKLNVPGEDLPGVSYCATCDGAFSQGEEVFVVGGGESAAEEALYMSNIADKTTLLVRGPYSKASGVLQKKLKAAGVKILTNVKVESLEKSENNRLNVSLSTGRIKEVDSVFIAIGQSPNSELIKHYSEMHTCFPGFVKESNIAGLFVAGDLHNPEYRQVIIAAGDGARAGIDAVNHIVHQIETEQHS